MLFRIVAKMGIVFGIFLIYRRYLGIYRSGIVWKVWVSCGRFYGIGKGVDLVFLILVK